MQAPGSKFKADNVRYEYGDAQVTYKVEVAGAYPEKAGMERWTRTLTVKRGDALTIEDDYEFSDTPGHLTMSLLTPCEVDVEPGSITFDATTFGPKDIQRESGTGRLDFDDALSVRVEEVPITDDRLGGVWGDHLNRVVFKIENPPQKGIWIWQVSA
jgi:hypothetical protein